MKKKRLTICGLLAVAVLTVATPLFFKDTASAASPAKWIDKTTISYDGKNYTDNKTSDNDHQFHKDGQDDNNKCVDVIRDFDNTDITKATKAQLVTWQSFSPSFNLVGDAYCIKKDSKTIDIDSASLANATQEPTAAKGQKTQNSCEAKSGVLGWLMCPVLKILDGVFNWLDTQIQALLEINEDAYTNPLLYQAWSNIRNIAFIVLIPIMLIMVIGTAMGSELFSAYTVKKALPRMVAAIIFITLSWNICTFLIGFFNVIGSGMIGLITNPFGLKGTITLADLFTPSFGGFVLQGGGLAIGILATAFVAELAPILLLYFGGAVLVFFLAFLVLTIRQMMILGLILAAPLAILAWIFPGNDKLWKVWWGTFSKLLIMYPLITALIAMGRVFAYLVGHTESGGLQGGLINPLLKITAYIMPYVFIPLTFKFAGGAFATLSGAVNDRSRGLFDRMKKGRQNQMGKIAHNAKEGKLLRYYGGNNKRLNRAFDSINKKTQTATLAPKAGFSLDRKIRSDRIEAARSAGEMHAMMEGIEKLDEFQPLKPDDDKLWAVEGRNEEEIRKILIKRAPSRFNDTDKKLDTDRAVQEVMAFKKKVGHGMSRKMAALANGATGTGYNYRQDDDGNFIGDDDWLTHLVKVTGDDASMMGQMIGKMRPMFVQSGRPGIAGGGYAHTMKVAGDLRKAMSTRDGIIDRLEIDPTTGDQLYEMESDGITFKRDVKGNKIKKVIRGKYGIDEARFDIMQDVLRSNAGAAVAGKVKDVKQLAPIMLQNLEGAVYDTGGDTEEAQLRALDEAIVEAATLMGKHDAASAIAPQNARELKASVFAQQLDVAKLNPKLRELLAPIIKQKEQRQRKIVVTNDKGQPEERTITEVVDLPDRQTITVSEMNEALRDHPVVSQMRREYARNATAAAQAQLAQAGAQLAGMQQPGGPTGGVPPFGIPPS
ncbi:MAG TPA: hypothetical protein VM124_03015 [Candidatus Limnocylindrales bacterium]|nr:hypothetical protein [Candidatus Limnocylindrales bacterium]